MATILLAEDHVLVRSGVRSLLERSGHHQVIAEATDGREAVELAQKFLPDLVLMDVAMPNLNGIEATRQIRDVSPNTRILMLSMHGEHQYVYQALRAGASGYILKDAAFTELETAIKTVLAGKTHLNNSLSESVISDYVERAQGKESSSELDRLTSREREVLQLLAEGNSSAEIARSLFLSVRTIETHRQRIMAKINIHTIAGLTRFAIRHGLCSIED
jgi:DNA-binding NarL/FixJ family response regulator